MKKLKSLFSAFEGEDVRMDKGHQKYQILDLDY